MKRQHRKYTRRVLKARTPVLPPQPRPIASPASPFLHPEPIIPTVEVGRSGLNQTMGFIQEDFLRELQGQQGARAFREMVDNSSVIGGLKLVLEMVCRQVKTYVEPFKDENGKTTPDDEARAEFVEDSFEDMKKSPQDMMSEILTMIEQGYSVMEVTYKYRKGWDDDPMKRSNFDDGKLGWADIGLRAQESIIRWQMDDETNQLAWVEQIPAPDFQLRAIPREKFLLFRTTANKDNPEGRSLVRTCYFEWQAVKRLMEFMLIGVERDLTGLAVMEVPAKNVVPVGGTATANQTSAMNAYRKIVENARTGEQAGLVIPQEWDDKGNPMYKFSLMGSPGQKQLDIKGIIEFRELRMMQALAMDLLALGHEKTGSFALSQTKSETMQLVVDALLTAIDSVFNREAIPRLAQLNGWPMDRLPKRQHGEVAKADISALATALKDLAAAGFPLFPDPDLEDFVREESGLPTRVVSEEDTGISIPKPQPPVPAAPPASGPAPAPAQGKPPVPETPPGQPEQARAAKVAKTPPWHIVERDGKFLVVGVENGKTYGTHDTKDEALAHMRALYANVPDAQKGSDTVSDMTEIEKMREEFRLERERFIKRDQEREERYFGLMEKMAMREPPKPPDTNISIEKVSVEKLEQAPVINLPPAVVNVAPADVQVHVAAAEVNVPPTVVNVEAPKAPNIEVNVEKQDLPAPQVVVHVPQQAPPVVNVDVKAPDPVSTETETVVTRDGMGNIKGTKATTRPVK